MAETTTQSITTDRAVEKYREVHAARDAEERPLVAFCGYVGGPASEPKWGQEITCVICRDRLGYGI